MALHVGEIGATLEVTVGESLNGLSSAVFAVRKPDGTEVEWSASVVGDEDDGVLEYATVDGDLDQAGVYKLHAKANFANGRQLIGDKATFEVYETFHNQ